MKKNLILIIRLDDGLPSGVARYVDSLLKGLKDQHNFLKEFDVVCLSFCTYNSYISTKSKDYTEIKIPFIYGTKTFERSLPEIYNYFDNISVVLEPTLKNRPKIITHIQEMCFIYLCDILKSKYGTYNIFHQHVIPWKFSYGYDECSFNRIYDNIQRGQYKDVSENILERDAYNLSDRIISVTNMAKTYIHKAFDIPLRKIEVIYNGIDDKSDENFTQSNDLLFVGRLSKEKGFNFLIDALALLSQKNIRPKLIAVGEDLLSGNIKQAANYYKLNIEYLGKLTYDELTSIYKKRPIGIIPSIHEQCSYTAIEMSMHGLPVIYSDVDGLHEIFDDKCGCDIQLSFDKYIGITIDTSTFADKINLLLTNAQLRSRLSYNSRKNYLANFTSKIMISKTLNLYYKCL